MFGIFYNKEVGWGERLPRAVAAVVISIQQTFFSRSLECVIRCDNHITTYRHKLEEKAKQVTDVFSNPSPTSQSLCCPLFEAVAP